MVNNGELDVNGPEGGHIGWCIGKASLRRKNNVMMIISTTARRNTESGGKCLAMKQIRHKTWTRIGLIRYEGGSVLFHVEIVH